MAFLGWQALPGSVAHFRLWPRGRDLRRVSSGALRGGQNGGGRADAVAWLGKVGLLADSTMNIGIPSGKLSHNYGKIHHFQWENPL